MKSLATLLLFITALAAVGDSLVINTETKNSGSKAQDQTFDPQAASRAKAQNELPQLEAAYLANPTNAQAGIKLASTYSLLRQPAKQQAIVTRLIPLGDKILADAQSGSNQFVAALQIYQLATNVPRMEECLNCLVKLSPTNPELWYDLGAILSYQSKTNAALGAVSNAVYHSNIRLRQNPGAMNLRTMATTDGRFTAIRHHPDFKKIVTPEP